MPRSVENVAARLQTYSWQDLWLDFVPVFVCLLAFFFCSRFPILWTLIVTQHKSANSRPPTTTRPIKNHTL